MTTRKFNQLLVSLGVTITLLANAYPQASRTVMVQSNTGVLLFPTNLFTANASSARSGLSLATHATNPIVPLSSGGTGATNAAGARTNLGLGVTNNVTFNQVKVNGSIVGGSGFFYAEDFNIGINVEEGWIQDQSSNNVLNWSDDVNLVVGRPIVFGTNASIIRTNLGLGAIWLTNTTAANFRSDIGLGAIWLTNTSASNFRSGIGLSLAALTNTNVTNFRTAVGLGATNDVSFREATFSGQVTITNDVFGGSFEASDGTNAVSVQKNSIQFTGTAAATTRTNLGLGATWLTNDNAANFNSALSLGTSSIATFGRVDLGSVTLDDSSQDLTVSSTGNERFRVGTDSITIKGANARIAFPDVTYTNVPANTTNAAKWLKIEFGTNTYYAPLYQ